MVLVLHSTVALALTAALPALAAVHVVQPPGPNGDTSSVQATLAAAASAAQPGDTVMFRPGIYLGGLSWSRGGQPGRPVTLMADGVVWIEGRISELRGLRRTDSSGHTYVADVASSPSGVAVDLHDSPLVVNGLMRVTGRDELASRPNCWLHDASDGKLYVRVSPSGLPGPPTLHVLFDAVGLALSASHVVVDGFRLRGFARAGIQLDGCADVTLRSCAVTHCGYPWGSGIGLHRVHGVQVLNCVLYRAMNGILVSRTERVLIDHCTVYATRAHGIMLSGTKDTMIRSTILFAGGASGSALYVDDEADDGLVLDHNCYLDFTTRNAIAWMPSAQHFPTFETYRRAIYQQDRHSVSLDPLFVETAAGREDLRLRDESPCRGAGENGTDIGADPAHPAPDTAPRDGLIYR